ncbi:NAD-dependent epimerase/dehydratase family protein [Cnuibacter physcomitrellae]|uniref:NAD-dependent epimerase/dehydratase family protein n=1 Tax=Cnuibacter physcomitrellae TaxID=1619308 RepID=UPI002175F0E6|nr:NAD-dependent epimerase/dehydratase family protein [Cnuibacter physcomitrellae]MCS5495792.1 NAD-dependent epimerase/dehydratase family protein [Cnuibacter physcomitrellae]
MRIVIVGASGNLGTAIQRRLLGDGHEVVGVSRRRPAADEPYSSAEWHEIDVSRADARPRLAEVVRGADAVVHLAWALQPNHDERAMWRTNVRGLDAVLGGVADAEVPQIAVASSVGAYSPGPKSRRVDERWPTGGIATSHYAKHKAMNERQLDRFEEEHPQTTVTRIRPGLVFQRDAAAEIAGLFLGGLVPMRLVGSLRLPWLPLTTSLVSQAIHASDVASAFALAVERGAGGAFNIAGEPVLGPEEVARVVAGAHPVPFRREVLRAIVWATWKLRLHATDPGWIDLATSVPLMSTEKARRELGWSPRVSSTDALAEIMAGLRDRAGKPSSASLRGSGALRV